MTESVVVVRTGTANLASVLAAFERLGIRADPVESAAEIDRSQRVVLPGVGSFGAGMARLRDLRLIDALRERVRAGRPTLGICLGLQMLAERSDESPGEIGVGAIAGRVARFGAGVQTPQFGWNRIEADPACRVLRTGSVYYANSYRLGAAPQGWHAAISTHGGAFVGALERGPVVLCQFHPELSGAFGSSLIDRWIRASEDSAC